MMLKILDKTGAAENNQYNQQQCFTAVKHQQHFYVLNAAEHFPLFMPANRKLNLIRQEKNADQGESNHGKYKAFRKKRTFHFHGKHAGIPFPVSGRQMLLHFILTPSLRVFSPFRHYTAQLHG
ncbi:MAG: hypothetical protein ACOX8B_07550 [Lachnospiraceae bacterium]